MYGYYDNKPALRKRLGRIEGQVRGISAMVEDDRYCIDILTQMAAIRSALDSVSLELIREHTNHCMLHADESEKAAKADELVAALSRMLKT